MQIAARIGLFTKKLRKENIFSSLILINRVPASCGSVPLPHFNARAYPRPDPGAARLAGEWAVEILEGHVVHQSIMTTPARSVNHATHRSWPCGIID